MVAQGWVAGPMSQDIFIEEDDMGMMPVVTAMAVRPRSRKIRRRGREGVVTSCFISHSD